MHTDSVFAEEKENRKRNANYEALFCLDEIVFIRIKTMEKWGNIMCFLGAFKWKSHLRVNHIPPRSQGSGSDPPLIHTQSIQTSSYFRPQRA